MSCFRFMLPTCPSLPRRDNWRPFNLSWMELQRRKRLRRTSKDAQLSNYTDRYLTGVVVMGIDLIAVAEQCQQALERQENIGIVVGFDGAVDRIMEVVDKRTEHRAYKRIPTIADFAARIDQASGLSTNIELITKTVKLGGCAANMSQALLNLGAQVSFVGTVGEGQIHRLFADLARQCSRVIPLAEPSTAQALEFDDGKIIMVELEPMWDVTWDKIVTQLPVDEQLELLENAKVIAMVNWTETPYMNGIWQGLLQHVFPKLSRSTQRLIFFDLADPQKRQEEDMVSALKLIEAFSAFGDVVLSLNRKEATEIATALGLKLNYELGEAPLCEITQALADNLAIHGVVVHPVSSAGMVYGDEYVEVPGPFTPQPRLTTGAGDNFNAGLVYGLARGLSPKQALILGVATSGFYVRNMYSPDVSELSGFLQKWAEGMLEA
jgi:sugar/nucleoside kinase (ribokinase family)